MHRVNNSVLAKIGSRLRLMELVKPTLVYPVTRHGRCVVLLLTSVSCEHQVLVTTAMVASRVARRPPAPCSRGGEVCVVVLGFMVINIYILAMVQNRVNNTFVLDCDTDQEHNKDHTEEEAEQTEEDEQQIISFEEDGRFGNLLMETATLVLIGQSKNLSVHILPQVGAKLSQYLSSLPAPVIDHTRHCVCTYCTDCLCPTCNKWTKIPSWTFMKSPASYTQKYLLLKWFNSDLVLRNLSSMREMLKDLLLPSVVSTVQTFLHQLQEERGKQLSFVSIHVRRTDYVKWIENRYHGHVVDHVFFNHCMNAFRAENPNTVFLVTSDDIPWCKENLIGDDVVFPDIGGEDNDPIVTDFMILTQANHSIYDYGSFGFWGAALAGGRVMVADGYSDKTHPILAAIRKAQPPGWTRVDVSKL